MSNKITCGWCGHSFRNIEKEEKHKSDCKKKHMNKLRNIKQDKKQKGGK